MFGQVTLVDLTTSAQTPARLTQDYLEIDHPVEGTWLPERESIKLTDLAVSMVDSEEKFRLLSGVGWGLVLGPVGLLAAARKRRASIYLITAPDGRSWMVEISGRDKKVSTRLFALSLARV